VGTFTEAYNGSVELLNKPFRDLLPHNNRTTKLKTGDIIIG